jgi:diadenosine tetraphosphatase ApaH/serine/threonine PP2A family protein phosphatase
VLGNHDAAAIGRLVPGMNLQALTAIAWTRKRLGKRQSDFLHALPLSVREDDRLYVHASAAVPERWTYITGPRQAAQSLKATDAGIIFSGHVHDQRLYYTGAAGYPMPFDPVPGTPIPTARHRQWLAIVGSAGQPRDRNTAACYALADLARARITFFRVPYDHGTAAQKIRAAGLPERLARRLERGS